MAIPVAAALKVVLAERLHARDLAAADPGEGGVPGEGGADEVVRQPVPSREREGSP